MTPPSTGKPELPRVPEEPPAKPHSPSPSEKLTPEKYYQLNEAVLIETGMTGIPHRPAPPPPSYRVQIAPPPVAAPPRPEAPTTFFTRRAPGAKLLLGIVGVLFFVAAGLAAGLGVSQRDLKQTKTALHEARVSLAGGGGNPAATPTPYIPSDVQCPSINGTLHTVANATVASARRKFKLLCGIDFSGDGEATDIGAVKTLNLGACADACAATANCTGAGWGVIPGDVGPAHMCWMKTGLDKGHVAVEEWGFAVIVRNGTVGFR
ncbi:hypothetical protein QBC39DRAFT_340907 [Podospora conica]|nr:hypothetical protein QBC39DRAFT_340907 [Schizothecium conicum]